MIEQRKQRFETSRDSAIGWNIIPMIVPRSARGVITEVDRNKGNARLHQPTREQGLLAPQMISVAFAIRFGFQRQIECLAGLVAEEHVDGFLLENIGSPHRTANVNFTPKLI